MRVRRYEFEYCQSVDCNHGRFVLHSDYASLLARHNALRYNTKVIIKAYRENRTRHTALVEAVAWERECGTVSFTDLWFDEWSRTEDQSKSAMRELRFTRRAARAEVDRLLSGDK